MVCSKYRVLDNADPVGGINAQIEVLATQRSTGMAIRPPNKVLIPMAFSNIVCDTSDTFPLPPPPFWQSSALSLVCGPDHSGDP